MSNGSKKLAKNRNGRNPYLLPILDQCLPKYGLGCISGSWADFCESVCLKPLPISTSLSHCWFLRSKAQFRTTWKIDVILSDQTFWLGDSFVPVLCSRLEEAFGLLILPTEASHTQHNVNYCITVSPISYTPRGLRIGVSKVQQSHFLPDQFVSLKGYQIWWDPDEKELKPTAKWWMVREWWPLVFQPSEGEV